MAAELICPHCESVIPDADDRGEALTTCPWCNGVLSIDQNPTVPPTTQSRTVLDPDPRAALPSQPVRFILTCERCGSLLEANSAHGGHTARCPTCGATFIVPRADPATGLPISRAVAADDGQPPLPMHAYAAAGSRAPRIERSADGSQAIECPRCGARSAIDSDSCSACGTPFTLEGASDAIAFADRASTLAQCSAALGISMCLPAGPIAIALGVLALIRAGRGSARQKTRRIAWIGIAAGAVSTILWSMGIAARI